MRQVFVTGAAGFIGSNLVDRLLAAGHDVVGWDNLSTGQTQFLESACRHARFRFVHGDNRDTAGLKAAMTGCDFVFHLAANADVRFGTQHPSRDLEQNTIATFNVLEAMRATGVRRIAFSSTGSVYGEPLVFPTPETAPFPVQTSLYAASKLAGEGLIAAYCAGFGFQAYIFRFVSILGERYTHGHVFDFYAKLLADPRQIEVLGNGKQRKSYLYVQDCIDAMLAVIDAVIRSGKHLSTWAPTNIARWTIRWAGSAHHLGIEPQRRYTGGERGWIGDSPFIFLDTAKVRGLGWRPRLTIRDGVLRTLRYLQDNPWVLERRRLAA